MHSPPSLNRPAFGAGTATSLPPHIQIPRAANVANTNSAWDTPRTYPHPCSSRQHGTPSRPLTLGRQPTYTANSGGAVQRRGTLLRYCYVACRLYICICKRGQIEYCYVKLSVHVDR